MSKLIGIFQKENKTLKVYESNKKLRGAVIENNEVLMVADFYEKDGDMDVYRVKEYFGFDTSYTIPFGRKNGKIVLYPNINKSKRIIWSNDDYDEWCDAMKEEITDEEITPEYYSYSKSIDLDDERANLDIEVDGHIIAFANLGMWNGRLNGVKLIGTNVKDILSSKDDYITWYCDRYDVRCDTIHHDGQNHILYRVAPTKDKAKQLAIAIANDAITEKEFRKATKSLRKYVADVYGW